MRTAYGVALALSLSLAVVRANETPEPILADAVSEPATLTPSNPGEPATPFPSNAAPEELIVRPDPESASGDAKVCVLLKADSFEIKMRKSPLPASAAQSVFLICDNVTTTSAAGGATSLKCTNCKLTLPGGVSATASDVMFDSKTNVLVLTGSDESPVTMTMAGTVSKAAKVEMKIDPKSWATPAGSQSVRQYGASTDPPRYDSQARY
jgi:hypothetical protein